MQVLRIKDLGSVQVIVRVCGCCERSSLMVGNSEEKCACKSIGLTYLSVDVHQYRRIFLKVYTK